MLLAEPCRHAVVEHHAVIPEHDPVAALSDGERAPTIGIDAVEQRDDVGALQIDLAESRRIEQAGALAHREALAADGAFHILAGPRIVERPAPAADRLEDGAAGRMPVAHRRLAHGIEELADMTAG